MKCPFLEEVVVRYCKAYPIRKMIPDSSQESICLSDEHRTCSTYREVARVDVQVEDEVVREVIEEHPEAPALKGSADYFPAYWAKFCKVLNCPVCPYRPQCLGAERRWLREPVLIHGFAVQRDLYYAPWHTWAKLQPDRVLRVGMDDFAQNLVGEITGVELPQKGTFIKEGEPAWKVLSKNWAVEFLSPVSGEIVDVNEKLAKECEALKKDPYKTGWVIAVKPGDDVYEDLDSLIKGDNAITWITAELDKLHSSVEEEMGVTIADGGELIATIGEAVGREEWRKLIREFLKTEAREI